MLALASEIYKGKQNNKYRLITSFTESKFIIFSFKNFPQTESFLLHFFLINHLKHIILNKNDLRNAFSFPKTIIKTMKLSRVFDLLD